MVQKLLTLLFIVCVSTIASALEVQKAAYNSATNKIELSVIYSGGLKPHSFAIQWDSCLDSATGKTEVAGRLVDVLGWDDTGTELIQEKLEFAVSEIQCQPDMAVIHWGKNNRVVIAFPY